MFTLSCCAIGKRGVLFSEMVEPPVLTKKNESLMLEVKNSGFHSALTIYKIEVQANHEKKELLVSAKQAITKRALNKFEIDLKIYQVQDIGAWTINWLNPDGYKTELKIENYVH